jgi:hypothetical protein
MKNFLIRGQAYLLAFLVVSGLWLFDHTKLRNQVKLESWCNDSLVSYINHEHSIYSLMLRHEESNEDTIYSLILSNDSMRLELKRRFPNPYNRAR